MKAAKVFGVAVFATLACGTVRADYAAVNMAKQQGIKTCLPAIESAAKVLMGNDAHQAHSTWAKNANEGMFSSFMIGSNSVAYLAAAPAKGECQSRILRIMPAEKSCNTVVSEIFGNKKVEIRQHGNALTVKDGGLTTVFYPVGGGCVTVFAS